MNALAGYFRMVCRQDGLAGIARRGARRLLDCAYASNSAWWLACVLDASPPIPEPRETVEVGFSSTEETIRWLESSGEPWMANPREIAVARKEGHIYAAVKKRGVIIGYAKFGAGNVYIEDYRTVVRFPASAVFIYDTYVAPPYRGRGIAPYLIGKIGAFARQRGFRVLGCHIPLWNTASLKAYAKAGFVTVRCIRHIRILGIGLRSTDPARLLSYCQG